MSQNLLFGEWLRQRRKRQDITQEELADRLGCSRTSIQKIEAGERRPSRQIAELLAGIFSVPQEQHEAFIRFARLNEAPNSDFALPSERTPGPDSSTPQTQSSQVPPPQSATRIPHPRHLPVPLTRLIGRETDVAEARELLLSDRLRLLTLVGPPGIGKTRLGVELAAGLVEHFEGSVFFVGLAPITDPALVPTTIASTLGLKEDGNSSPLDVLTDYLRDRRALLILDNFEQVVEAALHVTDLLTSCPYLKVLATSREALNVRGERRFPVQPLDMPDLAGPLQVDELSHYPAISLFVERAQEIDHNFELTAGNLESIEAICRKLDGLPLAIELVAARTGLFALDTLLERLDNRLSLLAGGPRDLPARHQTLRNAIGWSYDLLNEEERTLFTRMGVFVGGCTISAVEAACNANGDLGTPLPHMVESLLHKNLLKWEGPGSLGTEPRFTTLETVREYAVERLAASGEEGSIRRLHAEYYLALAEAAEPELHGPSQLDWLTRLELEHDNLRAALQWSVNPEGDDGRWTMDDTVPIVHRPSSIVSSHEDAAEIGLRMAWALFWFWEMHNHLSEGRAWLKRLLSFPARPNESRAKALDAIGWIAMRLGDRSETRAACEESLLIYRELGDKKGMARSLNGLANVAYDLADYDTARRLNEESLDIRREIGEKRGMSASLNNLGLVASRQGDYERAIEYLAEGLDLAREFGDKERSSLVLCNLGKAELGQGNYGQARLLLRESLILARELDYGVGISLALWGLGNVARGQSDTRRAIVLLAATQSLLDSLGISLDEVDREPFAQTVAELKASVGEEAFQQLWSVGNTMALQQVVDYALEEDASQAEGSNSGHAEVFGPDATTR